MRLHVLADLEVIDMVGEDNSMRGTCARCTSFKAAFWDSPAGLHRIPEGHKVPQLCTQVSFGNWRCDSFDVHGVRSGKVHR